MICTGGRPRSICQVLSIMPQILAMSSNALCVQANFVEQPSQDKLSSVAFNSGSITLVPQSLIEMNFGPEAATME